MPYIYGLDEQLVEVDFEDSLAGSLILRCPGCNSRKVTWSGCVGSDGEVLGHFCNDCGLCGIPFEEWQI
jgi:hypothetical protein